MELPFHSSPRSRRHNSQHELSPIPRMKVPHPWLHGYSRAAALLTFFGPLWSPAHAGVQPITTHTGGADVLISETLPFSSASSSTLAINFGFATTEAVAPAQFYDSFTVSVSGPGGTACLLTADASGIDWAPIVPGGLGVPNSSLQPQATAFLVPTEGAQPIGSFEVNFALPGQWLGVPLTVEFDMFDNQNQQPSLAYYALSVPDPLPDPANTGVLLLSVTACCLWFRRR